MKIVFLVIPLFLYGCAPAIDYTKIREDYVVSHPQLNQQTQADIRNGSITPGMTMDEVQASWGISDLDLKYERMEGTNTCNALGCMETFKHNGTYLTFNDGKLQSWTDVNY